VGAATPASDSAFPTTLPPAVALFIVAAAVPLYQIVCVQSLNTAVLERTEQIRRRLPFAVDLMALMLEAGANFSHVLETVVRENRGHPLGAELADVVRQVGLGSPRAEALSRFERRLHDQDVTDIVFAINKGEELGTPLSKILRSQADRMRLKRAQWGEKAATEAQVRIAFPGMLVMLACLLVILAPIILPAIAPLLN
jgi:tight adherence protein C